MTSSNYTLDENFTLSDDGMDGSSSNTSSGLENQTDYEFVDYCEDHIKLIREYDNPYYVTVCSLYFLFGIVCTFLGYRCFKMIMFLYGFIFGSIVVYLICAEENVLPEYANASIAVSAGILFGLITMLVQYVGLFMLGFHTGLLGGLIGLCGMELYYVPPSAWATLGILLVSGLVMALLNLYFQKSLTIFGSSLYGACIVMVAVDFFLQESEILQWIWDHVKVDRLIEKDVNSLESLPQCWISWLVFSIFPLLFILGFLIQSCCTGRGRHHQESLPQVKYTKTELNESKEERKQRKYRYLYQRNLLPIIALNRPWYECAMVT